MKVNELESLIRAKGSRLYFAIDYVYGLRTAKDKKTCEVSVVFFVMNLYMLFNVMQLNVRNETTSILFQGQRYLLQVISS